MAVAEVRQGREGSRWYNARPGAPEVAEWFGTIPLHDGLDHPDYIGGVVLIQATEKSDEVTGFDRDNLPQIRERRDLVYIPYVKVETRVAYFWKLLELHPEWVGVIEPAIPRNPEIGLPEGYFRYVVKEDPKGKTVPFVGCAMRVRIYERMTGSREYGALVMDPPPASKIIATSTKWDADPNALMKAETGAVGRALGMAGMLVIPGSGVATAEDMADAAVPAGATTPAPELPTDVAPAKLTDEELRERAGTLVGELQERDPAAHEAFQEWAQDRKLILAEASGPALKGAVRKLEKTLDELQRA
jgi:hypothetical protein